MGEAESIPFARRIKRFIKNPMKYPRLFWVQGTFSVRRWSYRSDRKRLFIDCGSNLGQGFRFFSKLFPETHFDYVMLEPNPHCLKVLRERYGGMPNLEIVGAAAWTQEGTMRLFGLVEDDRGQQSNGGSIVSEHNSARYQVAPAQAVEVPSVDFSSFVQSKSSYDEIAIKMDIESSEYEVLETMLRDGTISQVKHLFVEFHSQYMDDDQKSAYRIRERALIKRLRAVTDLHIWH